MAISINQNKEALDRKRRLVATSLTETPGSQNIHDNARQYSNSSRVNIPITKAAQFAGSAANTIHTQPMFFSPLHTPQNWQIASKKREIYQWSRFYYENDPKVAAGIDFYCFPPTSQVLMADGEQKSISTIKKGDLVRSHDGSCNQVEEIHKRKADENLFHIKIAGIKNGTLKTTAGHKILVDRNGDVNWIQVWELKKGDYLLTPINYEANFSNKNFIKRKVLNIKTQQYKGDVYDLTINDTHTYVVNRVAVHNSEFPINGFKLECKNKTILKYFEKLVKDLKLNHWIKAISHEYFLLGDVYPFLEIDCPECHGSGVLPDGEVCNHPGGKFRRLVVLNPDWIEVQKNVLASEPVISLVPDEELRMIVSRQEPKQIFNRLPSRLVDMVMAGSPIPLSNRCASHIAKNASPYGAYGTSLIRRLFTTLAYKTKLITANWIVAERLIIPIRVVKVGEEKRPATADDIQDVSDQLAAVANDPNVTIVTHHAFDLEWYGASGKIHNITAELEQIGKEMLDGLMLNQSLLNGEMSSYSSAQVGVETMIRRLEGWRIKLADWIEDHIFLPTAMMQGFVDQEDSEEMNETIYLYPEVKWNDLNLRDNSNELQLLMQLHDKGLISSQKLLEEFDINYDQETRRLRDEKLLVGPGGAIGGGGMPMPMGGGMPMPGGDMGGGMPGGDMGGGMPMPGGDMGGGMPVGALAGAGGDPQINSNLKIGKRGKGGKSLTEQTQMPAPTFIKLTNLESKMYKVLSLLDAPYQLYGQYQVKMAGEQQPFVLDFAYPQIGVAIETDGAMWHERLDLKTKDQSRDQKLANVGWRILRFKEDALNNNINDIQNIIHQNIIEAAEEKKQRTKKSKTNDVLLKIASLDSLLEKDNVIVKKQVLPNDLGYIWLIGSGENNG